jgi:hypothetical protein
MIDCHCHSHIQHGYGSEDAADMGVGFYCEPLGLKNSAKPRNCVGKESFRI